jgi:hypothetical protein
MSDEKILIIFLLGFFVGFVTHWRLSIEILKP